MAKIQNNGIVFATSEGGCLKCLFCKETEEVKYPIAVKQLQTQTKGFHKRHRICIEKWNDNGCNLSEV